MTKIFKEMYEANIWNFQRGGGPQEKIFYGGGMDNCWNYAILKILSKLHGLLGQYNLEEFSKYQEQSVMIIVIFTQFFNLHFTICSQSDFIHTSYLPIAHSIYASFT